MHLALLHQHADDIDTALRHAVREFLDGDRLRQDDLAEDLFLLLFLPALHALYAAAIGRNRACPLLLGGEGVANSQTATVAAFGTLGRTFGLDHSAQLVAALCRQTFEVHDGIT